MDSLCPGQRLWVMCVEGLLCIPQNMGKSGSERGFFLPYQQGEAKAE